ASLLLLLIMVGVSTFVTFDLQFSLGKICGLLLGVLLYLGITGWTTSRARLGLLVAILPAAGGSLAVLALLGTNFAAKFPGPGSLIAHLPKAIHGVPGAEEGFQPNGVAGALVMFPPAQIAVWLAGRHGWPDGETAGGRRGMVAGGLELVALVLTSGTLLLTQ